MQNGELARYVKNCMNLHSLPLAATLHEIRYNPAVGLIWLGLVPELSKGERRMHTRDCVLAEGACRVA